MWGLRRGLVRAGPGSGASEGAGPGAWGRGQGRAPCPHSGLGWAFHLRELSEAPVGASTGRTEAFTFAEDGLKLSGEHGGVDAMHLDRESAL